MAIDSDDISTVSTPSIVPLEIESKMYTIRITCEDVVKQTKTGGKTKKIQVLELNNIDRARRLRITAHPNGLVAELVPRYRYVYTPPEDKAIIPGQYTDIYAVSRFLVSKAEINEIERGKFIEEAVNFVAQQLESSGLWASRGKLRWRNVPEDFWKVVSIENFAIGTVKSYYQWWLSALLKRATKAGATGSKSKWFVKSAVHTDIENGTLPEKINSIRYWHLLKFDDLMSFVSKGWTDKKQWGAFIMHVRPTFYDTFMMKHNDWLDSAHFDEIVAYLARCPKTERMTVALNNLVNSGLTVIEVISLNCFTAKDVEKAANYSKKFQSIYRQNKKHLNSTYHPPVLKNIKDEDHPENNFTFRSDAVWADSITFPNLSDVYNCCVSRSESYENKICEGRAHTLYALDHTPTNQGGFLAYISLRDNFNPSYTAPLCDKEGRLYSDTERMAFIEAEKRRCQIWYIQEMRSYSNNNVTTAHREYVESVVTQLNKQLPGAHQPVSEITQEELVAELVADPIGMKIKMYWENRPR